MLAIGHIVAGRRLARGMTQAALARKAGIPQPNLSNLEKGKRDVTVGSLRRICRALGMRVSGLFRMEEGYAEKKSVRWGRRRRERVARAVRHGVRLTGMEGRVARFLGRVIPGKGRGMPSARETYRAWLELRRLLSPRDIIDLCQRVRDVEARGL